jgi:hypothetical protein
MLQVAVDTPNGESRVRVLWVAAVTMLRAAGHVLDKVDGASDPAVKRLLNEALPRWKKAWQYQQSVSYRNKTLKEYDLGWKHTVFSLPDGKDDSQTRHYGLLMPEGDDSFAPSHRRRYAANMMETLWEVWRWWMDRVAALGHLVGPMPLRNRQPMYDCFIGWAQITRPVL